jgi:hypothetical protein
MVSSAMGLLDEAIREHLELKRRRGADPSVVAYEEREALAPVLPEELSLEGSEEDRATDEPAFAEPAAGAAAPGEQHGDGAQGLAELAHAGQETAELDMRAVMAEDSDAVEDDPSGLFTDGGGARPYAASTHAEDAEEDDSLEWQLPGDRDRESLPAEIPGQERLSFE